MRRRSGFTVVEAMASLAVAGVVLILAHELLSVTTVVARDLVAARAAQDQEMNGRRWLRAALSSIYPASESEPFVGDSNRLIFTASLRQAGGWFDQEAVEVAVREGRLVARLGSGAPVILADSVTAAAFDYLLEPGANTRWVSGWVSQARGPVAARARLQRSRPSAAGSVDTLLLLIGGRR